MDTIRAELERVLLLATEQEQQLREREQAIAAAMELMSVDERVQMAFNDGICEERCRILKLIDTQLEWYERGSLSCCGLTALRRAVEETPWPMP